MANLGDMGEKKGETKMKGRRKIVLGVVLVALLAVLGASGAVVADRAPEDPGAGLAIDGTVTSLPRGDAGADVGAEVASKISYQGYLTDSEGNPVDGDATMAFVIFDAAEGGTPLWEHVQPVTVSGGLFSVELGVPHDIFNGQGLWLHVEVNEQVLEPRQELLPGPYALSLKPGAKIMASINNGPVVEVENTDSGSFGGYALVCKNASNWVWRPAIYGENTGASAGVYGRSDGWHATVGYQGGSNPEHAGVWGRNTGAGPGVLGDATTGVGGYFTSSSGYGLIVEKGNVGIGTTTPEQILHVKGISKFELPTGSLSFSTPGGWPGIIAYSQNGDRRDIIIWDQGMSLETSDSSSPPPPGNGITILNNGNVGVGTTGPAQKLDVRGTTKTEVLQITGGSDIAEPFDIEATDVVEAGMVLAIDSENPGKLRIAEKAYDRCVAGIVSGAGGIQPGMLMGQSGSLADGEYPVALTGRVYCWADASNGAIEPGDLLTTSDTPGHAMKVTDYAKAQGAIIGKAMSGLEDGKGLVLVLVTLQ